MSTDDGTYMLDHHGRRVDPFADAIERGDDLGDVIPLWMHPFHAEPEEAS